MCWNKKNVIFNPIIYRVRSNPPKNSSISLLLAPNIILRIKFIILDGECNWQYLYEDYISADLLELLEKN